ncbi:MAG: signal peptide peptidase SppA [Bacteroidota bacterium]
MKQFLKYTLATVFGIFITFIFLGILLFFTIIGLTKSAGRDKVAVKNNSVIELNINYDIPERSPQDFMSMFSDNGDMTILGLDDILSIIEEAKKDNKIKGIILKSNLNNTGYATALEVRNALADFRKAGKFIYAYAPYYDEKNYYLASVADSVFIERSGGVMFNGLSANLMFFQGTLEKLGVEMQVIKVGAYKGAVETFSRKDLSPENREQISVYINSLYGTFLSAVSESRKIDTAKLHAAFNEFTVQTPAQAVAFGLIDNMIYEDVMHTSIKHKLGIKGKDELSIIKAGQYRGREKKDEDSYSDKVAVIYAVGEIMDGEGDDETIGSVTLSKAIAKAREDKNVKAIVLRVNSPGGSSLASDIIMREIELCKGVKPVIVSMGDVAASGGYYISALADSIIAMPNTITGSIGVFGLFPNMQGLLNDKMGLTFESVKTGKYSDFGRVDRPLTDIDRLYLQNMVNRIYDDFTGVVERGRKLDSVTVEGLAQGRVWTASDALSRKLIDSYGGIKDAIKIAAYKAKIKNYSVVVYPKQDDPFKKFFGGKTNAMMEEKMSNDLGIFYNYYKALQTSIHVQGFQMRLPYNLMIQ